MAVSLDELKQIFRVCYINEKSWNFFYSYK